MYKTFGHDHPEEDEDKVHSSRFQTDLSTNRATTERRVSAEERSMQTKAEARKVERKDKKQPAVEQHDPAQESRLTRS